MDDHGSVGLDVFAKIEQLSPRAIGLLNWSEIITALKECQQSRPGTNTSFVAKRVFEYLVVRIVLPCPATTHSSSSSISSDKSPFKLPSVSSTARKSRTSRNKYSLTTWWFDDLVFLNICFVEKLVRTMISSELNQRVVSKFLFYYQKSKCCCAEPSERRKIIEAVISLLALLDGRSISFKGLFNIYQEASRVKVGKKYRHQLESLIGSQLDQVTPDYLLVPSLKGSLYVYDVDMVLKLVKSFLLIVDHCRSRLNKVGQLVDSYLSEVASDPQMKHSKFSDLVMALPDCARESHDDLYHAMNMYFEVHSELHEEEKISLCCALNNEKLSTEVLKHLATNLKFPSRLLVKAFMSESSKLTSLIRDIYHLKSFSKRSWFSDTPKEVTYIEHGNEMFEAEFQEFHWNEGELKKICRTTQSEIAYTRTSGRYWPKLCGC